MDEEKTLSISDYGWMEVVTSGIVLNKQYDEEDEKDYYQVIFLLNIDDNTDDGHFIHVPTQIFHEDKLVACHIAAQILDNLTDGGIIAIVSVFGEDGELIEEFDLNTETTKSMMSDKRVLH